MVSRPHDEDASDAGGGSAPRGRSLRGARRPHPRFKPQPRHRHAAGPEAAPCCAQPGGHGGPGAAAGVDRLVPRARLRGARDRLQEQKGRQPLRAGRPRAARGQAGALRGEGPGGQADQDYDRRRPERRQIDAHQSDLGAEGREGREPAGRHARQAVGGGGRRPSAARHAGHPVAEVRRPGDGAAAGLYRRREGRRARRGVACVQSRGAAVAAVPRRAARAVSHRAAAGRRRLDGAGGRGEKARVSRLGRGDRHGAHGKSAARGIQKLPTGPLYAGEPGGLGGFA